jgi:hypothetical protein
MIGKPINKWHGDAEVERRVGPNSGETGLLKAMKQNIGFNYGTTFFIQSLVCFVVLYVHSTLGVFKL